MSIRKAVASAIDKLMSKTLKEPESQPKGQSVDLVLVDLRIARNRGMHSLAVVLSSGDQHYYMWEHGRGAEVRKLVAMEVALGTTRLTWDHAAVINREVRAAENLCKIQF